MTRPEDFPPYSYRDDPAVPSFVDGGPVIFMDGECVLCSWGARLVDRRDDSGAFRICPVQSLTGQAVLRHYGLSAEDPETWLLLTDGRAETSLEATMSVCTRLGGWLRVFGALRILPRPARDWLYRRIARNRYWVFGRTDICAMPAPSLRARLIE